MLESLFIKVEGLILVANYQKTFLRFLTWSVFDFLLLLRGQPNSMTRTCFCFCKQQQHQQRQKKRKRKKKEKGELKFLDVNFFKIFLVSFYPVEYLVDLICYC